MGAIGTSATEGTEGKVTPAELVDRARGLVPVLRARAAATAENRRLPVETVADLRERGLLKVLQAPRNGGYGFGMRTQLDVVAALAEGCGSAAWVAGVTHAHSFMMSHFPQQAQDETYGQDPDAFISAVIAPRGRAERLDDGSFQLTGAWPFASGSESSQWLFVGAEVMENGSVIDAGDFLVPSGDVTFHDDWHVTGLSGTGSCTVSVDGIAVPAHRYLSLGALLSGDSPGRALHDHWQPDLAAFPVLVLALAGGSIGMAREALRDFGEVIGEKLITYTANVQRTHPTTHLMIGKAATQIDQAELLLYRSADALDNAARTQSELTLSERVRVRSDTAEAVALCLDAVTELFKATGGSGLRRSNPIGLALANLQAMSMHGALALETARELYGRVVLGLEPNTLSV